MKYTQIPNDTFQNMQMNAGILVDDFTPETGVIGNIIGATTGGISFNENPEYTDFGEDIDNCPKNTKELKKLTSRDIKISGTFVTINENQAVLLAGAADIDDGDETHIVPRIDLEQADFTDIWWIGDYSDKNTGANAGFMALHLMNALSTTGLQIQSTDKEKTQFAFEFTAHPSMNNQDIVPYEIFIKHGTSSQTGSILLNKHTITLDVDDTFTFNTRVIPSGTTVTWTSADSNVATVSSGTVTAEGAGDTIITASITVDGVEYTDTCTVVVTSA